MSVPIRIVAGASAPTAMAAAWRGVRRLLAVRLDNLGDLLMTTPALAALRDSLPEARITLLASPVGAAAAAHLDAVDEVWGFTAAWMSLGLGSADGRTPGRAETELVERLRNADFDAAVIFTVCTQSALPAALLCLQAGIPLRLAHCRENPYDLLSDWVPETDVVETGMRHEVQRQLDLVASVGMVTRDERLRFAVDAQDRLRLTQRLSAAGIAPDAPLVVIHPGASAASRRWPAANFGVAAAAIQSRSGCTVVFSGDADDGEWVVQAMAAMALSTSDATAHATSRAASHSLPHSTPPACSLAGALSLGELAALIDAADLLVTNNSGPAHLAAALGTPVVDLYALTNPQHTPWRVPARVLSHDVPCRWCLKSSCPELHHACLERVTPQQVADAAIELLYATRRAGPASAAPLSTHPWTHPEAPHVLAESTATLNS